MAFKFVNRVNAQLIRQIADRARELPSSYFPSHHTDTDLIYTDVEESVRRCHRS